MTLQLLHNCYDSGKDFTSFCSEIIILFFIWYICSNIFSNMTIFYPLFLCLFYCWERTVTVHIFSPIGYFSVPDKGNVPCFVYVTFNNHIYIHHSIQLSSVESASLVAVMERQEQTKALLEKLLIDCENWCHLICLFISARVRTFLKSLSFSKCIIVIDMLLGLECLSIILSFLRVNWI